MSEITMRRSAASPPAVVKKRESSDGSDQAYTHTPSITSPFYDHVVSPFCDKIIDYKLVPRWVTPNQLTLAGFSCSIAAVICAKLRLFALVSPLWILYGILDNLDGKQARATQTSSKGGDFIDHAVDSCAASLMMLLTFLILVPDGMAAWVYVWLLVVGQVSFYLGTWAHLVLGRTLLGGQVHGRDLFTVDEVNLLFYPSITSLRIFFPELLDFPVYTRGWTQHWLGCPDGTLTLGMLVIWICLVFGFVSSIKVVTIVYQPHVLLPLLPGLAYAFVSVLLCPPLLLMISSFSLITFMLLGVRLKKPGSSIAKIWRPILPYTIIAIGCKFYSLHVTWGLSNPFTASIALLTSCSASLVLIRYTHQLNQVNTS